YDLSAEVVVRSTKESALLLNPFPNQLRALASSTIGWDPSVAGQRAVDGNPSTVWVAGRGDTAPSLDLDWGAERTINQLTFDAASISASQPVKAIIEAGGERREVDLSADSLGYFKPITASKAKITFPMAAYNPAGDEL